MFWGIILCVLDLLVIWMLESIIKYFEKGNEDLDYLVKMSAILIAAKLFSLMLYRQYSMTENNLSIEAVLKLNCFIFDKILKLSPSSDRKKSTQGEIVNHLQIDSQKVGNMIRYSPLLLLYPLQIGIYVYLLIYFLEYSFLFGLIPLVVFLMINYFLYKRFSVLENKILKQKDQRMRCTTETFDSLKLLKMYSWEDYFKNKVNFYCEIL